MSIEEGIQTVGSALKTIGIDPVANQRPDSHGTGWIVPSEKGILFVTVAEVEDLVILNITAPILFMPPHDLLPFYRKILDLNAKLVGASLAMERDVVYVVSQQALDGLTQTAVESLLQMLRHLADALADGLWAEFRTARYWQPV